MDRAQVWPDFRAEWILHEDEDVVVIDKPAGVSSQAADPSRPDDVVTRLRAFLAARDGRDYLGVHQRLDRDTSGVVLFTKRPEVNAAIAEQFERRAVKKRYLAAVTGWPERRRDATLDDLVRKAEGGTMEVVRPPPRAGAAPGRGTSGRAASARGAAGRASRPGQGRPEPRSAPRGSAAGAQRAITQVTLRASRGPRALLELWLETGRTHQARVQLAHAGAPIAGDPLYQGAAAPRLLLHAASLELLHPRTKRRLTVTAEVPWELEDWLARGDRGPLVYDDPRALRRALALATERRWGLGRSLDRGNPSRRTTAFRLVHEEGDALPGLAVDVYGDHLVAQLYVGAGSGAADRDDTWADDARRARVLDALAELGFDGVYLKHRPRQANLLVDTRRDDLAPAAPVRGVAAPAELVVVEEGVEIPVRLGDGLSTGIFLDQRPNRRLVRERARGARVLNLFSYTCAFSVAAALGGAVSTTSVDASLAALERGRASFTTAGIAPGGAHAFVAEDVFAWLARAGRAGGPRFDLVVVDPPSYSSTKKRRFVAESDYGDLVAAVALVLAPDAVVLASVNHRGMSRSKLRRFVADGLRRAALEVEQVKDLPSAPDFPAPPGRDPYMKSVLAKSMGKPRNPGKP